MRTEMCVGRLRAPRATRQRCARGIRACVHRTTTPSLALRAVATATATREPVSSRRPAIRAGPTRTFVRCFETGARPGARTQAPALATPTAITLPTARRVAQASSAAAPAPSRRESGVCPATRWVPRWHRRPCPPSRPPHPNLRARQRPPSPRRCPPRAHQRPPCQRVRRRCRSPASIPSHRGSMPRTTLAAPLRRSARTLLTVHRYRRSARRRATLAQACAKTRPSGPAGVAAASPSRASTFQTTTTPTAMSWEWRSGAPSLAALAPRPPQPLIWPQP